jgi:hypothetical protein
MRRLPWELQFGLSLVALSALLYLLHYAWFKDAHHLILWTTTSIAFLPISVLFVTLIINRLLVRRERRLIMEKLNMLIGTFFSGVGMELIRLYVAWDPGAVELRGELREGMNCPEKAYRRVGKRLEEYEYSVDLAKVEFEDLRQLLVARSDFLLRLLENPHLLEHASFTNLLRAVFHLTEELANRESLDDLPDTDCRHLASDIQRAYRLIVGEWLDYMRYLRGSYPYLFSFAVRTNPFEERSSAVVR